MVFEDNLKTFRRHDIVTRRRSAIVDKLIYGEVGKEYRVLDYCKERHGILLDTQTDKDIGNYDLYAKACLFRFVRHEFDFQTIDDFYSRKNLSRTEYEKARLHNIETRKTIFHFHKLRTKRALADVLVLMPYSEVSAEARAAIGRAIDALPYGDPMPEPGKPRPIDNSEIVFKTEKTND